MMLMYTIERTDTSGSTIRELRTAVRLNAFLGFCAGFMLAYQNSSSGFGLDSKQTG